MHFVDSPAISELSLSPLSFSVYFRYPREINIKGVELGSKLPHIFQPEPGHIDFFNDGIQNGGYLLMDERLHSDVWARERGRRETVAEGAGN